MNCFKFLLISACSLVIAGSTSAVETPKPEALPSGQKMYVIERDMPGLGKLSPADLKAAAQKSCKVLHDLGPKIQWVQSYVTGDKMYCIYIASDADIVREHAKEGGFPANAVNEVSTIIGPETAK
ncbi:MAG TPA: DUF4242 domain-containing protein [Lacunisphaera sp.]|jgi:hypothetical protein